MDSIRLKGGFDVGFDEYTRMISLVEDPLQLGFIMMVEDEYPSLHEDFYGFTVKLPQPKVNEDTIGFLGYRFPEGLESRKHVVRLFRGTVYHLSGHCLIWKGPDYASWRIGKNPLLSSFVMSLLEDMRVNAYVAHHHPDKMRDLGFAGALMLARVRDIDSISIRATRLMVSLMIYGNTSLKNYVADADRDILDEILDRLEEFETMVTKSLADKRRDLTIQKMEVADKVYDALLEHGPIVEVPSPPFGENLGPNSLFPPMYLDPESLNDALRSDCMNGLSWNQALDVQHQSKSRMTELEALQTFDSHVFELEREQKIHSKYAELMELTQFNSISFPRKNYTGYLRAKSRCKKTASKMTVGLSTATNDYLEDIRKMYGVLDLSDAVQVVASKSERSDVFLRDEKITPSFAWAIVVDTSSSMRNVKDYTLETTIVLADSANTVLPEATAWGIFAFNDEFQIIKDFGEQFNVRTKARLGGLEFRGASYMPEAMELAGRALIRRREGLKVMIVISDGWPHGYENIGSVVTEKIREFEAGDVAVIGIGIQSGRMGRFFKLSCPSYTHKEMSRRFPLLYYQVCENAV